MATEVVVVGAGPAGCATATVLARKGVEVVLIDKAARGRDKCCGDGLTTLALRELEHLGADPAAMASWTVVERARLRTPGGRVLDLPVRHDAGMHAVIVTRAELDAHMVDLAVSAGSQVILEDGVVDVDSDADEGRARLTLQSGRRVDTRHVVAADGMWSPVRRMIGADVSGYRGDWHAFRQYFASRETASRDLWVFFETDLLPGYAWSFPLPDGTVNVGFGVLRGDRLDGGHLKELWTRLTQRPALRGELGDLEPLAKAKAWPIPARLPGTELAVGPVLFVGDAATACDPLTGEGIGQALVTGRLAAEAIAGASGDTDEARVAAAGRAYRREARSHLVADHRFATALSRLLRHPRVLECVAAAADSGDWSRRNLGRWLFEDYPRAVLATPRRWHRGVLQGPGAFAAAGTLR